MLKEKTVDRFFSLFLACAVAGVINAIFVRSEAAQALALGGASVLLVVAVLWFLWSAWKP